jgi:ADP-dependent NAD(P)H-hydrate dehydratase
VIQKLTADILRGMPLPDPGANSDKEQRGRVLVVGSSGAVPGAALLSGIAALRAGAGKLQLAVPRSIALAIGIACPESGIIALDESADSEPSSSACGQITKAAQHADGILVGPGLMDAETGKSFVQYLLATTRGGVVVDAAALAKILSLQDLVRNHEGRVVLTPHAGEMATLLDQDKRAIEGDPERAAREVAERLRCVVALKGATTFICGPDGSLWRNDAGAVGLGTCGSGDVLAGIITGLVARGTEPIAATLWGVFVHARIGEQLSKSVGALGFLARELLQEIPATLEQVAKGL